MGNHFGLRNRCPQLDACISCGRRNCLKRLPDDQFQRIVDDARARHSLSFVAGRHTALKRRGPREPVGLCLFREDRTPSFEANDAKVTHYFAGGEGGDAITFRTKFERISFMDELRWLAGNALLRAGNPRPD
ncbi:MAG: hypothetical protein DI637_01525 [Citromicrobium sp.]|nr:MAG: hypothetical protein DI637_01525 [Citromicrobium sp.]